MAQPPLGAEPVEQAALPQETFPSGLPSYGYSDMSSMSSLADMSGIDAPRSFVGGAFSETDALSMGLNFNEFPKSYRNGLLITKDRWAVKIGGYVKADLIHDFDPIDSTDFFDPSTIPVGSLDRSNTRFHARQTRMNLDARWLNESGIPLRFMIEGDFYGQGNTFRLRHAYGEYNRWIVGQTWTTFTHRAALPNTLDNVGDVAS
ncbi:MAG: hypothetical protein ACK50R_05175, partial [Planctomycetota bacterium]